VSRKVRTFRSKEELRKLAQVEEGTLPQLPVTSDGFVYRWLRVAVRGEDDVQNISRRQREGWELVKPEELPKEFKNLSTLVRDYGKVSGIVGIDDVALGRIPRQTAEARQELVELEAAEMMQAVNADLMRNNDTRMPISNESKSTLRRGRNAHFSD
jgi:hypothetical protein